MRCTAKLHITGNETFNVGAVNGSFQCGAEKANSCLIAAAPDLLEALKEAFALLQEAGLNEGCKTSIDAKVAAGIRAAIAKAEGGAK